jgi:hypothetical protein
MERFITLGSDALWLPGPRTRLRVFHWSVVAFLLTTFPGATARAQGAIPPPELDLDKLYTVQKGSFARLASRLMSLTRAKTESKSYAHVRFQPFEGEWASRPDPTGGGRRDFGEWVFIPRGQAQVIGNGRMWSPRPADVQLSFKELTVLVPPGKPRSLHFRFEVCATEADGNRFGPSKKATVLGREGIEMQLLQHPGDKSLRLVLDPMTFRTHQGSLDSNWVVEEKRGPEKKNEDEKKDGKLPEGKAAPPAPVADPVTAAASEVTLVKYFQADEREIIVGFRRKWSGLENRVVDGRLHINMDSSLSTTLYYDVPTKSGKTEKLRVAYFIGGHRIR